MARLPLNLGAYEDDPSAETLRAALVKTDANFAELYAGIDAIRLDPALFVLHSGIESPPRYNLTAALDAAIGVFNAVAASAAWGGTGSRADRVPAILIPAGAFVLDADASWVIRRPGFKLVGAGRTSTTIGRDPTAPGAAAVVFDFGLFEPDFTQKSDVFVDEAGTPEFRELSFINGLDSSRGTQGARSGTLVRYTGGAVRAVNLGYEGFKYGIATVCGGDFMALDGVVALYNDCHLYCGPGAQQVQLTDCHWGFGSVEGCVFDRVAHLVSVGGTYHGASDAPIVIEEPADVGSNGQSRFMASFPQSATSRVSSYLFLDPYIEGFSAAQTGGVPIWTPSRFFKFDLNGANAQRGLRLIAPRLFAGTDPAIKMTAALFESVGTLPFGEITVDNVSMSGAIRHIAAGTSMQAVVVNGWYNEQGKGTAVGATTDATGYAAGATTITLAATGSGNIVSGDVISFAGDPTYYAVSSGDSNVADGGAITINPGLQQVMSASAKAITVWAAHPPPESASLAGVVTLRPDRQQLKTRRVLPITQEFAARDGLDGCRVNYGSQGVVSFDFINNNGGAAQYLTRFGIDVQNRRVWFGDPAVDTNASLSAGSNVPEHTAANGSYQFNTAAAPGLPPGWRRVAGAWVADRAVPIDLFAEVNPPSFGNNSSVTISVVAPGAQLLDIVDFAAPYDLGGYLVTAVVAAAGTIKLNLRNQTGATNDLPAGNWRFRLTR